MTTDYDVVNMLHEYHYDPVLVNAANEIEALRAEVGRLNDLCNGLHRSLTDSQAGFVHHRDRAERLAEALRYAVDNPDFDSERFDALARAALEQEEWK